MDFVIGRVPPPGSPSDRNPQTGGQIEARVLHVREPRRRRDEPGSHSGDKRRPSSANADPPGARVLVLLVPEAHRLPENLHDGSYRIFLRVVRR
ncbi:MAG: hypothetical protein JSV80_09640 [Acidobacteriota bacterium]|nr:MAG: hypothetical protein JSV80_09640 [Acidobacteriota bacterium]